MKRIISAPCRAVAVVMLFAAAAAVHAQGAAGADGRHLTMTTTLLVLAGSWRKGSFNAALARAAVECAPAGCEARLGSIRDIPLYDYDVEVGGIPPAVLALKDAVVAADGVLLVTPEYNNSLPGTFKNAIDWLSRPPKDAPRIFRDRPFGLIGATPGMGGTRLSQSAWLPVLRTLSARLWTGGSLFVADAGKVFGADGSLVDAKVKELLTRYLQGFAAFAAQNRVTPPSLPASPRAG